MEENLRLALIQCDLVWENKEANFSNFNNLIDEAGQKADVIVLPEMFSTGFSMNASDLAEPLNSPTLDFLKRKAFSSNACITGSFIITDEGKYFNRLYWVFPDGTFEYYDKRHLFRFGKEDEVYTPGNKRIVVEWKGWKICPLVCYDLRFPVWIRNIYDNPYDVLIFVANWPSARTHVWDTLLKARAIENVCYVAGVNRTGEDGDHLSYEGHSQVLDAKGLLLNELSKESKAVYVTLEKSWLTDFRKKFNTLLDGDNFEIIL